MLTRTARLLVFSSFICLSLQQKFFDPQLNQRAFHYSAAAYCAYETLTPWDCGTACKENSDLQDTMQILDSSKNTFCYAGYSPSQN